jgi:uncharacterized protein YndB with AHSA1/START domain
MQDEIVREIIVKANKEKVYGALTDIGQLTKWFPDIVEEGTLEVGQQPVFIFSKWNHKTRIFVEAAKPFEYFSYRWVPGGVGTLEDVRTQENTLVEFFIEEVGGETKVTVKESGFSKLPAEIAQERFTQNSGGWQTVMASFEKYLNQ